MVKALLINSDEHKCRVVSPNLGLTYLQAYLTEKEVDVELLDLRINENSLEEKMNNFSPDVVGLSVHSAEKKLILEYAHKIRQTGKTTPILFGGINPTVLPESFLFDENSYVIRGEGEHTTAELISVLTSKSGKLSKVQGVSFKNRGKVVHNPSRKLITNLDELPMPSIEQYFGNSTFNQFQLMPSRGCYHACTFCSSESIWEKKLRKHSPARVLAEIDRLVSSGIDNFIFADDSLTLDIEWSREIMEGIIREGYNLQLPLNSRVDFIRKFNSDNETMNYLNLLKQAGVSLIIYGVESGSQTILDRVHKGISQEESIKAIELTKKAGIAVKMNLIVGLPGSYEEQIETVKFLDKFNEGSFPEYVAIKYYTPFEGTKIRDKQQFGLQIVGKAVDYDSNSPEAEFHNNNFQLNANQQINAMKTLVDKLISVGYSTKIGEGIGVLNSPISPIEVNEGTTAYTQVAQLKK